MNLILFEQLSSAQTEKTEDPLTLLVLHVVGVKATVIAGFGGSVGSKYFFINNFNNSLESGKLTSKAICHIRRSKGLANPK